MTDSLRLRDVIEIERGSTYKSALIGQPGPILLGLASIERNGGFRSDSLRTYGGDSPARLLVKPGQLYASLKDVTQSADLLGSVARLPADLPTGRLTQDTVRLEVISDVVTPDYLYWCLRTPQYRAYCRSHATGTTNLGLPRDDFLNFEIPMPTPWRLTLVAAIRALDDLMSSNRTEANQLDALCRALGQRFIDSLGACTRAPLGEVAAISKGYSYKSAELIPGGAWLVNLKNVGRDGAFHSRGFKPLTGGFKPVHLVDNGDICVAQTDLTQKRDIIGRPIRVRRGTTIGDLVASLDLVIVRPGVHVTREYLYAILDSPAFRSHALGFCNGTTVVHMASAAIPSFEVPIPHESELRKFSDRIESLREEADQALIDAELLKQVRDALLPLLMSGRIRDGDVAA